MIRDGRVVAAGPNVGIPSGARIVDATGKWVTPGLCLRLFAAWNRPKSTLALTGPHDQQATSPFNAAIDVAPAVNPQVPTIAISRADGVTRAIVSPSASNNIFAGQGALIDTGDDMDADDPRARLFQFVELGEQGAANAGGSRAAAHVLFRSALREAASFRATVRT